MTAFSAGENPCFRFVRCASLLEFSVDVVRFALRAEVGSGGEDSMVLVGVIDGLTQVFQVACLGFRFGFTEIDGLTTLELNRCFRLPHVVTATVGTKDDSVLIWECEGSTLWTEHTTSRKISPYQLRALLNSDNAMK